MRPVRVSVGALAGGAVGGLGGGRLGAGGRCVGRQVVGAAQRGMAPAGGLLGVGQGDVVHGRLCAGVLELRVGVEGLGFRSWAGW